MMVSSGELRQEAAVSHTPNGGGPGRGDLALGSRPGTVKGNEVEPSPGLRGTSYDIKEQKLGPSLRSRSSSLEWGSSSKITSKISGTVIWGPHSSPQVTLAPSSVGKGDYICGFSNYSPSGGRT